MSHWLEVVSGRAQGERLDPGEELVVGRGGPGMTDLGGDPELSRRHARFGLTQQGELVVEDLGSTNGTLVNGHAITQPTVLKPGDRVEVGGTVLEVRRKDTTRVAPTPSPVGRDDRTQMAPSPPAPPAPEQPAATPPAKPSKPTPSRLAAAPPPTPPGQAAAAAQPPQHPEMAGDGRRDPRVPILALLLVLAVAGLVVSLVTGGSDDDSATPAASTGAAGEQAGTVYVMSHELKPDENTVFAVPYSDEGITPLSLSQYPTGGTGGVDLTETTAIDADQQVWTDPDRRFLFATNQGSDTIAVFRIADDGALTPVDGSPFPSRGPAPVSVGVADDTVVVANKALDGVRDLEGEAPNVVSFRLEDDGRLTPAGEPLPMRPGQTPTQAWVTPDERHVIVSDLFQGNYFTYEVQGDGAIRQTGTETLTDEQRAQGIQTRGPPPPLASGQEGGEDEAPPGGPPEDGGGGPPEDGGGGPPAGGAPMGPVGAQGIVGHPRESVMYSELSGLSAVVVHTYDGNGGLTFERAVRIEDGFLACWADVSPDGRFLYVSITFNNTIAVLDLADPRNPRVVQRLRLRGPGNAFNVRVAPGGRTLFAVSTRLTEVDPGGTGNFLHALEIGPDGRVAEMQDSPVQLPVGLDGSAAGLVVVPRD